MDQSFLSGLKEALAELRPRTKTSKLLVLVSIVVAGGLTIKFISTQKQNKAVEHDSQKQEEDPKIPVIKKKSTSVDMIFFKRLAKILKIVLGPKEIIIFVVLTFLLFARTMLSVRIAEIIGGNAQYLVSRDWKRMWRGILQFALITIPASVVNAGLKYFSALLALHFRVKLSQHVHNEYIKDVNFYKACNLGGEERIENADQRVTADIAKFSESIAELYTTLFKPVLDVILFTAQLNQVTGWQAPAIMYSYFFISGIIKKSIMPSFGRLVAKESELEGIYRTSHQRLITNSEEIAFYDGSKREKSLINNSLAVLEKHILIARYLKGLVGIFDGLLVKYWASIAGYVALSVPIVLGVKGNANRSTEELTRAYIRNGQYLGNLSSAVGDLVLVGNKLMNIAGFTSRVSELLEQVNKLSSYGNTPFKIREEHREGDDDEKERARENFNANSKGSDASGYNEDQWIKEWRERQDELRQKRVESSSKVPKKSKDIIGGGKYEQGDKIEFRHADIVSPEGKLLVKDLSISVERNQHVMITGPNGAGKSSLFRIIGELWPLHNGVVVKPAKEDILFVPQKPYLVMGTLRDQIIYPHSVEQMKARGVTDKDLENLLRIVDPHMIILTNWNWEDVKDWFLAFSGGQKQRVAMARLFYHRPLFSILDECTSAVSDEVEDKIYETCTKLGITLFTVSHRSYLRRYHEYILRFEGRDGIWEWSKIPESERKKF